MDYRKSGSENIHSRKYGIVSLVFTAVLFIMPASAFSIENNESSNISVNFENDFFYNTDRNYTNGFRIFWLSAPEKPPAWTKNMNISQLLHEDSIVRWGVTLGQNMYTPANVLLRDPPEDDRPYAGWLYSSFEVDAETGNRLDQFVITVGIVGPASQAEYTQKFMHKVVGDDQPEGWDTQLKDEFGFIFLYQRSWKQFDSKTFSINLPFDITPHAGVALGNVLTYANIGLTLRIGQKLPRDYGPSRIPPGSFGSGFFNSDSDFCWYFFAGFEGRAVARNIFLDGNTFRDSRSVNKKILVGDMQLGFAIIWQDIRLSYTHVLRTREFESQKDGDDFGALSISLNF